jgi:dTDP-4-dehydrorhamnose 3,5-epimerase
MNNFVDDRGYSIFDLFPLEKGQINYSELHPGIIKAFHRHQNQTDYWMCIEGDIMVNLVEKRKTCSFDKVSKVILSSRKPQVLEIKPGIWHGYKTLGNKPAKLLYFVTKKYDSDKPDEARKNWDVFGKEIWDIENK